MFVALDLDRTNFVLNLGMLGLALTLDLAILWLLFLRRRDMRLAAIAAKSALRAAEASEASAATLDALAIHLDQDMRKTRHAVRELAGALKMDSVARRLDGDEFDAFPLFEQPAGDHR